MIQCVHHGRRYSDSFPEWLGCKYLNQSPDSAPISRCGRSIDSCWKIELEDSIGSIENVDPLFILLFSLSVLGRLFLYFQSLLLQILKERPTVGFWTISISYLIRGLSLCHQVRLDILQSGESDLRHGLTTVVIRWGVVIVIEPGKDVELVVLFQLRGRVTLFP